jgi:hypothetical protein
MADNKLLPPTGTGTANITARTKDRSGIDTTVTALDINGAGAEVLSTGDATNGLDVDVTRVSESLSTPATATWDSSTAEGTALTLACAGYPGGVLTIQADGGSCSAGMLAFEASTDGGTLWDAGLLNKQDVGGLYTGADGAITNFLELNLYDSTSVPTIIRLNVTGLTHVRIVLDVAIVGTVSLDLRLVGTTTPSGVRSVVLVDEAVVRGPYVAGLVPPASGVWPVVMGGQDGGGLIRTVKTDTNGELQVDVLTLPALAAGTANIGDVDIASIAAGDNNIGNVDIVTMPNVTIGTMAALVAGTANIGDVDVLTLPNVTLAAGTNTNEVVGDVASDVAIAANPVTIGVRASSAVPSPVSADGAACRLE